MKFAVADTDPHELTDVCRLRGIPVRPVAANEITYQTIDL